jgi:23S rRNA (uridine2552-2'-O)-methyltransferase
MKVNRWDDHYTRQARDERWPARSVYKLKEMDEKFRLIHKGNRLLDLGCFPGSWSKYGLEKIGPKGEVVGIDLIRPESLSFPNYRFIHGNVLSMDMDWLLREVGPRDVIMSDLAPKTTGMRSTDASRSMELAERATKIALALLKEKGHLVCKVFEGEDLTHLRTETSVYFRQIRLFRPKSTRKRSREIYLLGLNLIKQSYLLNH